MKLRTLLLAIPAIAACKNESELTESDYAPQMALNEPAPAAWMSAGAADVAGEWVDIERVEVNGKKATMSVDGSYTAEVDLVRGINVIESCGISPDGDYKIVRNHVIAGAFEDPGAPVQEAADIRVNQAGLDAVMGYAGDMVTADAMSPMLEEMNPVTEYDVLWGSVWIAADITDLDFGAPSLEASPRAGVLAATVEIPNLFVDLSAYGDYYFDTFETGANMTADSAVITADITIDAEDGQLVVELLGAEVDFRGFAYDLSLIPYGLEDYLFVDTIRGTVEDMLLEQLEAQIPALLDETLAGLDLSFDLDLMDEPLAVSMAFEDAEIDNKGLALTTSIDASMQGAGAMTYAGFLASPNAQPSVSTTAPIAAGLADELVNRILFEVWRAGVLDMRLSTDDGSLDAFMLLPLHAEQGTITTRASLPPVMIERDGGMEIQVGELFIDIETPGGEMGEHLGLAVAAFVAIEMVVEDNEIVLEIGEPELNLMVRESDWGASDTATTQLIEEMLPIDVMLALLGDFSFPLPLPDGLTLEEADVSRDASGYHTALEIEIGL